MRAFGRFKAGREFFYGEVIGDEIRVLTKPYWLRVEATARTMKRSEAEIAVPVAPAKLMAIGLNYADHIAEMKRTPLGTPLLWFKAPSSLIAHAAPIEIAFPEHQTDFEVELVVVIGRFGKNISRAQAREHVFGYSVGLDI